MTSQDSTPAIRVRELRVLVPAATGAVDTLEGRGVDRTIEVDLKSHFHFLSRFVPLLKHSNLLIIAIGSVAGRLGHPCRAPCAATKWAIVGLARNIPGQAISADGNVEYL